MVLNAVHTIGDKQIIIRTAVEGDAANLLHLKKSYIEGSTSIPMYVHEYTNSISEEAALIKRYSGQQNSVLLVAECDGLLIGNLDLTGNQREKLYHTAMLGMGVAAYWQNKKIGSLLIENAIKCAKAEKQLDIVWLEVYSTNTPGRRLYENFGFKECGTIRDFFHDTPPADKITMVKHL